MNQFRRDFVGADTLGIVPLGHVLILSGEIGCKGGIVVRVEKELEYVDAPDGEMPSVQTVMYCYNVSVQGVGNVFRYDNQHPEYLRPGHSDPHHKHLFNWKTNDELSDSPVWIGAANWPTLGQVIHEVVDWHAQNYSDLDNPDGYPASLQSGSLRS